jgi:hypothetical protein
VKFSCGSLPSLATCSFAPASVTPSGGTPITSTLTITTAAATAMLDPDRPFGPKSPWIPAGGLALAGVIGSRLCSNENRAMEPSLAPAQLGIVVGFPIAFHHGMWRR